MQVCHSHYFRNDEMFPTGYSIWTISQTDREESHEPEFRSQRAGAVLSFSALADVDAEFVSCSERFSRGQRTTEIAKAHCRPDNFPQTGRKTLAVIAPLRHLFITLARTSSGIAPGPESPPFNTGSKEYHAEDSNPCCH